MIDGVLNEGDARNGMGLLSRGKFRCRSQRRRSCGTASIRDLIIMSTNMVDACLFEINF
jgi:hypothetical protein